MNEPYGQTDDPSNTLLYHIKAVEKNQEVCIITNLSEFVGSERRK
jgi:hypothetical protein